MKKIQLSENVCTTVMYMLAGWVVCPDERQNYHVCKAVVYLLSVKVVEEALIKEYGEEIFAKKKQLLMKYYKNLSITKYHIDSLKASTSKKDNKNSKTFDFCVIIQSKIPLISTVVFELLAMIIENSNLNYHQIRKHHIRPLDMQYTKEYNIRPMVDKGAQFDKRRNLSNSMG